MITIPEYVYKDTTLKFVCPSLELSHDKAAQMRAVLTDPNWPDVLDEKEYICHAFLALGFDSNVVWCALIKRYGCGALDGCLKEKLPGHENWKERDRVATLIREKWCQHMRDHLEKTLKQG